MGTLSDGHCPLLVHSSKLLPVILALEILYTWDGDYALVRPLYDTERSQGLLRILGTGDYALVRPLYNTERSQ